MKATAALALILAAGYAAPNALASVTLEFSLPGTRLATDFSNAGGSPTDGMNWGIVIDTGNNGFNFGSYTAFPIASGEDLSTGSGITDDYFFPASTVTVNTSGFTETNGSAGGHGTITTISNVPIGTNGIAFNEPFALVWFPSNTATAGSAYGEMTDATFLIPSDGSTTDLSGVFAGPDPDRAASLTVVPEPASLWFLASGGLIGMAIRLRRKAGLLGA